MKTAFDFDKAALDVFSSEGAPPGPDPLRPQRATSLVACPVKEGVAQRYRGPLWRPFRPGP